MGIHGVGHLDVRDNPDLLCIQVDDSIMSLSYDGWYKDSTAHYSEDCGYTGVEDYKFENKSVSVAPNPASDFIEIDFNNVILSGAKDPTIRVYDLLGVEVINSTLTPALPKEMDSYHFTNLCTTSPTRTK